MAIHVYSPSSGYIWNVATYGNGTTHTAPYNLGGDKPLDIGGYNGQPIYFIADPGVYSIKIRQVSGVCKTDPAPWNHGIRVYMYKGFNYDNYLGSVGFGHLKNRRGNADIKYWNPYTRNEFLGRLPSDCDCGCSDGIHIHTQAQNGWRSHPADGQYMTKGWTKMYSFNG